MHLKYVPQPKRNDIRNNDIMKFGEFTMGGN